MGARDYNDVPARSNPLLCRCIRTSGDYPCHVEIFARLPIDCISQSAGNTPAMASRVVKSERVIRDVSVAIPGLWIAGLWYNSIRTDPAAELRVIPPSAHLDQVRVIVVPLPGLCPAGV